MFELTNERWVREKFSSNEPDPDPYDILLDFPRDMYPFSVFGLGGNGLYRIGKKHLFSVLKLKENVHIQQKNTKN